MALALIVSGCDFLDKKDERSDVVIEELVGGHYRNDTGPVYGNDSCEKEIDKNE